MINNLDISAIRGLSGDEAANRLRAEGYNELPPAKPRSILAIAWDVVPEPMFLLLVACGVIYLLLGDREEALMLLGFVFVVMGITLYQERKTERALEEAARQAATIHGHDKAQTAPFVFIFLIEVADVFFDAIVESLLFGPHGNPHAARPARGHFLM